MPPTQTTPEANPLRGPRDWGRWLGLVLKIGVPIALVAAVVYYMRFAPIPVTAETVTVGAVVAEVMGTGTLEAKIQATISPKISGRIVEVPVDQGDRVEAGQILVLLDDSDLRRQVEVAESGVAAARAAVERQTADRERSAAILHQARIDYDRTRELIQQGNASSLEMDKATEGLRVAEADLGRADAALNEARMLVITAERTLDYHQARLADATITAPYSGLIVRRDRDPGAVVVPGTSILQLVSTDVFWIRAWVDETEMSHLQPGQPARVVFRAEPDRSYAGQVARLGREVDRETREFLVDVHVSELPSHWAAGQRAEVYIETGRAPQAVRLPARFLSWRDSRLGVFVEERGRAVYRRVRTGLRGPETVEIKEGLREGERVIAPTERKAALRDGQRVELP